VRALPARLVLMIETAGENCSLSLGAELALVDPHLASHARFSVGTVLYCDDLDFKAEIFLAAVGRFEG
jgi:hypothetical protein